MIGRRAWLRALGLGLSLGLAGGAWLGRGRLTRWRVARALRMRLSPLTIPDAVLTAFLADVARHDAPLAARLDEEEVLDLLAARLLLSSDHFTRGASASGQLGYLRYANVYVNACINPLARFVEEEPSAARSGVEAIYHARCATCHEAGVGPSLEEVAERVEDLEGVIRDGRGAMPPARALGLDDESVTRIAAWIRRK